MVVKMGSDVLNTGLIQLYPWKDGREAVSGACHIATLFQVYGAPTTMCVKMWQLALIMKL